MSLFWYDLVCPYVRLLLHQSVVVGPNVSKKNSQRPGPKLECAENNVLRLLVRAQPANNEFIISDYLSQAWAQLVSVLLLLMMMIIMVILMITT